jgi:hypothetical protein
MSPLAAVPIKARKNNRADRVNLNKMKISPKALASAEKLCIMGTGSGKAEPVLSDNLVAQN